MLTESRKTPPEESRHPQLLTIPQLRNETKGKANSVVIPGKIDKADTLLAKIHTHPEASAFSDQDIIEYLQNCSDTVNMDYVVSKGALYVLYAYDPATSRETAADQRAIRALKRRYNSIIDDNQTIPDYQKRSESAVKAAVKCTGLLFYIGDDKYEEVKIQS